MQINPAPVPVPLTDARPLADATGLRGAHAPVTAPLRADAVTQPRAFDPASGAPYRQIVDPDAALALRRANRPDPRDDPGPYGPPPAFANNILAHLRATLLDPSAGAQSPDAARAYQPGPEQAGPDRLDVTL